MRSARTLPWSLCAHRAEKGAWRSRWSIVFFSHHVRLEDDWERAFAADCFGTERRDWIIPILKVSGEDSAANKERIWKCCNDLAKGRLGQSDVSE